MKYISGSFGLFSLLILVGVGLAFMPTRWQNGDYDPNEPVRKITAARGGSFGPVPDAPHQNPQAVTPMQGKAMMTPPRLMAD